MYIFTMPKLAYELKFRYEDLIEFLEKGKNGWSRKVGTTVTIEHLYAGQITIWLYDTIIAELLSNGNLMITESINKHGSQATGAWVSKVLSDNGIHRLVGREKGKYAVAGEAFARSI